jgi:hypothetical protein
MELDRLKGRADLKDNGVWVIIKASDGEESDFECKTAYSHCKEPRDYVAKEVAKARRKVGNVNRDIPQEVMKRITVNMLMQFCLKDWRGLTNKGAPVPYEERIARDFFGNHPEFLDKLAEEASDLENFGGKLTEEEKDMGEVEGGVSAATKSGGSVDA